MLKEVTFAPIFTHFPKKEGALTPLALKFYALLTIATFKHCSSFSKPIDMENSTVSQPGVEPEFDMVNGIQSQIPILPGQLQDSSLMTASTLDSTTMPSLPMQAISADEVALYDRQIRLWGMKAQELIRNANILLLGMKALGNEIAKNLVLAGVGGLTILDSETVTEDDLGSQFLITENDIGKNRAEAAAVELRRMNPRVSVLTDQESIMTKLPAYFAAFQIVIVTGQTFEMASTINMSCRMFNVKFYYAEVYGMYGFVFSDLILHQFTVDKENPNVSTKSGTAETSTRMVLSVSTKRDNNVVKETVTKQEMYCPLLLANSSPLPTEITKNRRTRVKVPLLLSCLRAFFEFQKQIAVNKIALGSQQGLALFTKLATDKHAELQLPHETLKADFLRSFMQNLGTEIPPTAAFIGGQLAQDVINVLSQREQPLQNLLLFDGDSFLAPIYSMQPIFDPTIPVDGMDQISGTRHVDMNSTDGVSMVNGTATDTQQIANSNGDSTLQNMA